MSISGNTMTDQELADAIRAHVSQLGRTHISTRADDLGEPEARVRQIIDRISGQVYLGQISGVVKDRWPAVAQGFIPMDRTEAFEAAEAARKELFERGKVFRVSDIHKTYAAPKGEYAVVRVEHLNDLIVSAYYTGMFMGQKFNAAPPKDSGRNEEMQAFLARIHQIGGVDEPAVAQDLTP